ncbi:MAG: FAD-binding oxidoreductase [Gammaproteobacteria bacterium]|nr:FAD-binding oxidoreductase [Gammaproteobacteria bacterium]
MKSAHTALAAIRELLGPEGTSDDPDVLAPRLREWRDRFHGATALLIRPATTGELSQVMRLCHEHRIGVVPQGGNTGLCGGAIPDASGSQVLISLERMQRILEVDAVGGTITAEAGCVLSRLQQAARDAGAQFALSLAAQGSAQIGGCIATNAGGTNVLRYGTARQQVLGLEVVLPDGRILDALRGLRKDTAGYDVKQWFIGAEGTLGIITKACCRLHPLPQASRTVMAAVRSPASALHLLAGLRGMLGESLSSFELLPRHGLELVLNWRKDARDPFDQPYPWYVLLEGDGRAAEDDALETALARVSAEGMVEAAVVAGSIAQAQALWQLRDELSAAQKHAGPSIKHDVAVPLAALDTFIARGTALAERLVPGSTVLAFGHVGDGNVHFNIGCPPGMNADTFLASWEVVAREVHDLVVAFGGTASAEHGIGQLKVTELARLRGGVELELMHGLKAMLDPHGIMNPGKVLAR